MHLCYATVHKRTDYLSSLLKSSIQLMDSIVRLTHEWYRPPAIKHPQNRNKHYLLQSGQVTTIAPQRQDE